jgi:cysteine desulfurase
MIPPMIYLDCNATTPIAPEVREAMMPYLTTEWGNPSSSYRFGSKLKSAIETARAQVAQLLGAEPWEILFTSCATESNNAAIHAALRANPGKPHIITSTVEHSSVLSYCRALEKDGYRVTYLPVDRDGLLKLADLENAITDQTAVVSLMWANNETGVLFPVEGIAQVCRSRGVLFHCDAVQAASKVPVNLRDLPVDYLSISGHKFGALKGVGALYIHRKAPFSPLLHGGHQERGLRGGTENIAPIVGMGKAAELALKKLPDYDHTVRPLRDLLEERILNSVPDTELNGHKTHRLANTTDITFLGIESAALLLLLDQEGVCASAGSACLADSDEPSHVIQAMKPDSEVGRQAIRFSLGLGTTDEEVRQTCAAVERAAQTLRVMNE